jgi:hypothetical protein
MKPGLFRHRALLGWISIRDPTSPPSLYVATKKAEQQDSHLHHRMRSSLGNTPSHLEDFEFDGTPVKIGGIARASA